MTEQQILSRMNFVESEMARERHPSTLRALSETYQKLLDKLVEIDMRKDCQK